MRKKAKTNPKVLLNIKVKISSNRKKNKNLKNKLKI